MSNTYPKLHNAMWPGLVGKGSPGAEPARLYLSQRKLLGPTVQSFGLGFAPSFGDWLVQKAASAKISMEMLETVGVIAPVSFSRSVNITSAEWLDNRCVPDLNGGTQIVGALRRWRLCGLPIRDQPSARP